MSRGCPPDLRAQRDWEDLPRDLRELIVHIREVVANIPEAEGFKIGGRRKFSWGGGEVIFFLPVGGKSDLGRAFAMDYQTYQMMGGGNLAAFITLGIRSARRVPELARFPRWRSW